MEVTEIRKRKSFTMKQRSDILNELYSSGMTVTALARKHEIHPVTIHNWKQIMLKKTTKKRSKKPTSHDNDLTEVMSENQSLKEQLDNLKKAFADISIDNQILKTYNNELKKSYLEAKLKKRKK